MLEILDKEYAGLEKRVLTLLDVGRRFIRAEEGGIDTSREFGRGVILVPEDNEVYGWLLEKGIVLKKGSKYYPHQEGGCTFTALELTGAGRELYDLAEGRYIKYLQGLKKKIS